MKPVIVTGPTSEQLAERRIKRLEKQVKELQQAIREQSER